jgi:hypothetical protein
MGWKSQFEARVEKANIDHYLVRDAREREQNATLICCVRAAFEYGAGRPRTGRSRHSSSQKGALHVLASGRNESIIGLWSITAKDSFPQVNSLRRCTETQP